MELYRQNGYAGRVVHNSGIVTMNNGTVIKQNDGWAVENLGTFNFKGGTINLNFACGGTALYNTSGTINMSGGSILSKGFGLCVDGGNAKTTGGSIQSLDHWAVLIRNNGSGEFISTTIKGDGGHGILNEADYGKAIIRSRASNYGVTGDISYIIATTNTGPGQAQEKVTTYNTICTNVLFPTWTATNGQDDIDWMRSYSSSTTHTVTILKSKHNNETGEYAVHIYGANSSWQAEKWLGGLTLTF